MEAGRKPLYYKLSHIITALIGIFFLMYLGQEILKPLIFSALIAILLNPVVNWFTKKNVPILLGISITIILLVIVTAAICWFLGWQATSFVDAFPKLKANFYKLTDQSVLWASHHLGLRKSVVSGWLDQAQSENFGSLGGMISQTILTFGGVAMLMVLIPVYIFLFLFYKPLLLEFIAKLFPQTNHPMIVEILGETKMLIQNYLVGLIIEMALVALLNTVGLMIIGVPYAILLGLIGGIINVIPYIGGIVGTLLPVIIAIATRTPSTAIWVILLNLFVQFLDNNIIVPKIVASKVKINALVSVVVVLIGGALWGVGGMFLSIPLTALVKVICDRINGLKPLGYLIGDDVPPEGRKFFKFSLAKRKLKIPPLKRH